MTALTFNPSQPIAADSAALNRVLHRARVHKDSLVRVCGKAGMTAMLWLCRHGYQRAAYSHAGCLGATDAADVLLIPNLCGPDELGEILGRGGRLREDGVLIVQGGEGSPALLQAFGFEVEHRLSDKGRAVYVARRRSATLKQAA
jgi:hypothetical protein